MSDLSVRYLGLTLKNPIIVGSCGLTSKIEMLKSFEENGASAVVLKSIFEEEILREAEHIVNEAHKDELLYSQKSETLDYLDIKLKEHSVQQYIDLIVKAKSELLIPVIASVNCMTEFGWLDFVSKIEQAGADAIELNVFFNPLDAERKDSTETYINIFKQVRNKTKLPIAIKLNSNYSNIANTVYKLDEVGINGLVLFNRFYTPDVDIDTLSVVRTRKYSKADEYGLPLQWIAFTSQKVTCDLVASTGIHTGETVIKQLLVGASAIQMVSSMYEIGPEYIQTIIQDIETWMEDKEFTSIQQFQGKLAYRPGEDSTFDRMQYMKYFSKPSID